MALNHRQKKKKAREERLRHRGTQESFRPPTPQELRNGRWGIIAIVAVLVIATGILLYAIS